MESSDEHTVIGNLRCQEIEEFIIMVLAPARFWWLCLNRRCPAGQCGIIPLCTIVLYVLFSNFFLCCVEYKVTAVKFESSSS